MSRRRSVQLPGTPRCHRNTNTCGILSIYLEIVSTGNALVHTRTPRPVLCVDLYFDGTQVTRSFTVFGGSYAPGMIYTTIPSQAGTYNALSDV
jgi:hypothetical protein